MLRNKGNIDIHSDDILQTVRLKFEGCASAILVDGDEVFISTSGAAYCKVLVLQYRVIANLSTIFLGSICPPNHTKEINLT